MSDSSTENQRTLVRALIREIAVLSKALPHTTVRLGHEHDKIPVVFSRWILEWETPWHTFVERIDALFAEDCRDDKGRLHHIRRGPHGMELVADYLEMLVPAELETMPADLMLSKLTRIRDELEFLVNNLPQLGDSPPKPVEVGRSRQEADIRLAKEKASRDISRKEYEKKQMEWRAVHQRKIHAEEVRTAIYKLRAQAKPAAPARLAREGPETEAQSHWHKPIGRAGYWLFECRYCGSTYPSVRDPECNSFAEEHPQPCLRKLSDHMETCDFFRFGAVTISRSSIV
ncbi:hypothetical protein FIBSPDRAFT_938348 [Athelia psychrophila]|uniref:Uncharacterized protein n=1 Tax=Athelia psychrophila TaxID=1759441 RepID=A0A165YQ79_9AGAM|nr:hypothetical protein FIBSPDRAFT_938348 [Fibularhizoctonia sp. CBS 109695]